MCFDPVRFETLREADPATHLRNLCSVREGEGGPGLMVVLDDSSVGASFMEGCMERRISGIETMLSQSMLNHIDVNNALWAPVAALCNRGIVISVPTNVEHAYRALNDTKSLIQHVISEL